MMMPPVQLVQFVPTARPSGGRVQKRPDTMSMPTWAPSDTLHEFVFRLSQLALLSGGTVESISGQLQNVLQKKKV